MAQSGNNLSPNLDQSSVDEPMPAPKKSTNLAAKQYGVSSDLSKKHKSILEVSNASIKNTQPSVDKPNPILLALQATINTLYKKVH